MFQELGRRNSRTSLRVLARLYGSKCWTQARKIRLSTIWFFQPDHRSPMQIQASREMIKWIFSSIWHTIATATACVYGFAWRRRLWTSKIINTKCFALQAWRPPASIQTTFNVHRPPWWCSLASKDFLLARSLLRTAFAKEVLRISGRTFSSMPSRIAREQGDGNIYCLRIHLCLWKIEPEEIVVRLLGKNFMVRVCSLEKYPHLRALIPAQGLVLPQSCWRKSTISMQKWRLKLCKMPNWQVKMPWPFSLKLRNGWDFCGTLAHH